MKATLDSSPLFRTVDYKRALAAIKRTIANAPKDRETAIKVLMATGMHTKTGQLKKRFR